MFMDALLDDKRVAELSETGVALKEAIIRIKKQVAELREEFEASLDVRYLVRL